MKKKLFYFLYASALLGLIVMTYMSNREANSAPFMTRLAHVLGLHKDHRKPSILKAMSNALEGGEDKQGHFTAYAEKLEADFDAVILMEPEAVSDTVHLQVMHYYYATLMGSSVKRPGNDALLNYPPHAVFSQPLNLNTKRFDAEIMGRLYADWFSLLIDFLHANQPVGLKVEQACRGLVLASDISKGTQPGVRESAGAIEKLLVWCYADDNLKDEKETVQTLDVDVIKTMRKTVLGFYWDHVLASPESYYWRCLSILESCTGYKGPHGSWTVTPDNLIKGRQYIARLIDENGMASGARPMMDLKHFDDGALVRVYLQNKNRTPGGRSFGFPRNEEGLVKLKLEMASVLLSEIYRPERGK